MKAVLMTSVDEAVIIKVGASPEPTPGEGQLRIAVEIAGVSFVDHLFAQGRLPLPIDPFIPGSEVVGVVDLVGPNVAKTLLGRRVVASLPSFGGLAEFVIAPDASVFEVPQAVPSQDAVAIASLAPAALMVLRASALTGGETIFVPSAAGAVGTLIVQLAKRLFSATVFAGATGREGRTLAESLGAAQTIDTNDRDWPEKVVAGLGGRGADVVLVRSGGDMPGQSLRALAPGGRLVLFGAENLYDTAFTKEQIAALVARNQSIVGVASFSREKSESKVAVSELFTLVEQRMVKPIVTEAHGLEEIDRVLLAMKERRTAGKIVVDVRQAKRTADGAEERPDAHQV